MVAASREAYHQRGLSITVEPLPTGARCWQTPSTSTASSPTCWTTAPSIRDKATGQVTITGAVEGQDFLPHRGR